MTVSTTNNRKDYVGTGSLDTYAFDFPIFADTDLEVYQDGALLTLTTDYTVALDGDAPNTGEITLVAGNLGSSVALAIVRDVPTTQGVDLVDNDPFPAETIEAAFDRLTMLAQQNHETLDRAITLAPSSTESGITVEDLDGHTGEYARVNATEDGIEFADIVPAGSLGVPVAVADGGTAATTLAGAKTSLEIDPLTLVEGVAPGGVASKAVLYALASDHQLYVKRNNGAATRIPQVDTNHVWTGSNEFGTVILSGGQSVGSAGIVSPAQITGNQNDYTPGITGKAIMRISTDASRNITGLAGATSGQVLSILNVGAQDVVLTNEDAASTAANRFALGANVTLGASESILLWYDSTSSRWRALGRHN